MEFSYRHWKLNPSVLKTVECEEIAESFNNHYSTGQEPKEKTPPGALEPGLGRACRARV